MPQRNWTCSKCGGSITELPFEPKSDKGLVCRSCYATKQNGSASGGAGGNSGSTEGDERKMYEGNWKCAECGNAINKLPFEPKSTNNLRCIDCFKKNTN